MKNIECNNAINRIFKNINIDKIDEFIDSIECMSNVRKLFYKNIIKLRYNVLKDVFIKLNVNKFI